MLILAAPVFLVFWSYVQTSLDAGNGAYLLPVDDVYIHFQYARQIANGQPYVYNPGLAPTSGATSFVYPYILALGYILGFTELNLALWAMIVGAVALFLSAYIILSFALDVKLRYESGIFTALAYIVTGSVSWHFMSGMETGIAVLCSLALFWTFFTYRRTGFIFASAALTLIRPEGGLIAAVFISVYLLREWLALDSPFSVKTIFHLIQKHWVILLPLLAFGVQPLMNYLLTGSLSASGNQAKSLLGIIPAYPDRIAARIVENFVRAWWEFLAGMGENQIWFLPPFLGILGYAGLIGYAVKNRRYDGVIAVTLALFVGFGAISTLDTAFWHFKRYHMPLLVWVFPLLILGFTLIKVKPIKIIALLVILVIAAFSVLPFSQYFAINVSNVFAQPYSMAVWLKENTPENSVIAVHDVGLMRYFGERTTLDMVGLTTPQATDYWRNGPGSVAEFLMNHQPDYVAAYTAARGLSYLAETPLYGQLLEGFTAQFDPRYNVALGGEFQGVFKPEWSLIGDRQTLLQDTLRRQLEGFERVDRLNVADIASENDHHYQWENVQRLEGFITEVYEFSYMDCVQNCTLTDGGRLLSGTETFVLEGIAGKDHVLVTRIHPAAAANIRVLANNTEVSTRVIPALRGQWLDIATVIPARIITTSEINIQIEVGATDGVYMPYDHRLFVGAFEPAAEPENPVAAFQDEHILLNDFQLDFTGSQLSVELEWWSDGLAQGDYITYVHVYDNLNEPPVAQVDMRSANGTLPPGNWLSGILSDEFVVDLSQLAQSVTVGEYVVAVGFYDAQTQTRLVPEIVDSGRELAVVDGRLLLDRFEFPPE